MAIVGGGVGLGQEFMPKHWCDELGEEEKEAEKARGRRLRKPLVVALASAVCFAIVAAVSVSLRIVFPGKSGSRPFCRSRRGQELPLVETGIRRYGGAFYLTNDEAADFYWMVVFVPSAIVFFASGAYLLAGMVVAYSASPRHSCLKVVENTYCASKRGGVRCLSILNIVFALVFGLLALILGSTLLTSGSSCSIALFWCYEITLWGLVVLYGGTAFFLRRKASIMMLHQVDLAGRNHGVEMQESRQELNADIERHMNDDSKA
ncbi:hypothetical protein Taro_036940 [Colocasia esculenta]|uniref:Transmembrane protein n=1 Tax=Colocasia esculenta TaxID=4460 RepID=A0A843W892_COLES|nr:hypothetical protein [Colocasia esculenta]